MGTVNAVRKRAKVAAAAPLLAQSTVGGGSDAPWVGRARMVRANELDVGLLEAGTGPLALCLHGFPDSAHTWRHLLSVLAEAGFHAVAPFRRGNAPTAVPDDAGCYDQAPFADAVHRLAPIGA